MVLRSFSNSTRSLDGFEDLTGAIDRDMAVGGIATLFFIQRFEEASHSDQNLPWGELNI